MATLNNPWFIVHVMLVLTVLAAFVPIYTMEPLVEERSGGCSMIHSE